VNYATGLPTVATVQSGGADLRYYVYTPSGSLLFSVDAASGVHRYYSFDNTGSTTMLTDDSGSITDAYGISPYGEVVTAGPNNSTDNPFTWQGQLGLMQEPGTGLYYARFRYYDSATARFLSRDPLFSPAPREIDPYQYARGNPLENVDASGLLTATVPAVPNGLPNLVWDAESGRFDTNSIDFSNFSNNNLNTAPTVPTFINLAPPKENFPNINVCPTDLLFTFLTNQAGFDTGLEIQKTSTDPFGTSPSSSEPCRLNWYGPVDPAGINSGAFPSPTIYNTLASNTPPGFSGYMIAVCNFQYAHGFAFISDIGARNLAMGYLALIIPGPPTSCPER
jgi:RHS repeat-associated protein